MNKASAGCFFLFSAFLLFWVFPAQAIAADPADSVTFSLDRSGPALMQFKIEVDGATGHGFYGNMTESGIGGVGARAGEMPITVGAPVLKQLFAALPAVVNHRCESHSKNLAQTGKKTLRYRHADAAAECTYNYSDDERVNAATNLFVALAQTIDFGQQLSSNLRFDRLGLDTTMENLESAVKDGRAVEVGNISTVLRAIEEDDRVLERVRRKAAHLLEGAGLAAPQPSATDSTGTAGSRER